MYMLYCMELSCSRVVDLVLMQIILVITSLNDCACLWNGNCCNKHLNFI